MGVYRGAQEQHVIQTGECWGQGERGNNFHSDSLLKQKRNQAREKGSRGKSRLEAVREGEQSIMGKDRFHCWSHQSTDWEGTQWARSTHAMEGLIGCGAAPEIYPATKREPQPHSDHEG